MGSLISSPPTPRTDAILPPDSSAALAALPDDVWGLIACHMHHTDALRHTSFYKLRLSCQTLRVLVEHRLFAALSYAHMATDAFASRNLHHFTGLHALRLSSHYLPGEKTRQAVLELPKLTELVIRAPTLSLLQQLSRLTSLVLLHPTPHHIETSALGTLTQLRRLETDVDGTHHEVHFGRFTMLRELVLDVNYRRFYTLLPLGPLRSLRHLELRAVHPNDALNTISALTQLQSLALSNWWCPSETSREIGELTWLTSLSLHQTLVPDTVLARLVNLRTLHLHKNRVITGSCFAALTALTELTLSEQPQILGSTLTTLSSLQWLNGQHVQEQEMKRDEAPT